MPLLPSPGVHVVRGDGCAGRAVRRAARLPRRPRSTHPDVRRDARALRRRRADGVLQRSPARRRPRAPGDPFRARRPGAVRATRSGVGAARNGTWPRHRYRSGVCDARANRVRRAIRLRRGRARDEPRLPAQHPRRGRPDPHRTAHIRGGGRDRRDGAGRGARPRGIRSRRRRLRGRRTHGNGARACVRMTRRIEDYALLSDLQSAALVHRFGSVDWCCFPRFDSGACFAALLGEPRHGRWLLAPVGEVKRSSRRYRADTLILESVYETVDGAVRAIDFMPPRGNAPDIVRIVEGLDGSVPMRSELVIRFDFGRIVPWMREVDGARAAIAGPDGLCFRTPVETRGEDLTTVSEFVLDQGERVPFVLTWFPSHESFPAAIDP